MKRINKYALASKIAAVIDIPFWIVSYPHILIVRLIKRLMNSAMRQEFVIKGMCAGCSRFGTKSCRIKCKNPYATIGQDRNCFTTK